MIVFDASVLIAYLNGADAHHARAVQLCVDEAGDTFGVNPLTLAEVLVGPARVGKVDIARQALTGIGLAELPWPAETAEGLARLRATSSVKMPDCCVLLTALDQNTPGHQAAAVAAFDDKLRTTAASLGLRVLPSSMP